MARCKFEKQKKTQREEEEKCSKGGGGNNLLIEREKGAKIKVSHGGWWCVAITVSVGKEYALKIPVALCI